MQGYIVRHIESTINQYLDIFPVVAILGPRQCGKSTLIKKMAKTWRNTLFLDLQNQDDLNKLRQPTLFFSNNSTQRICLDEIQLVPELFSVLRGEVDQNRKNGRFILLGSASRELVQKTSESLAGRIGFINLTPFIINELENQPDFSIEKYWLRGGFPDSYLAKNDENSNIWRENFIRTFIERDIPQLGFQIPALQLRRFLTMCAHNQGQILNSSKLGDAMGLTHPTIRRYIDLLEQTFILRTLPAYETNVKKRLIKSPKLYIRDCGLLHRLLSIDTFNALLGHPVIGNSWEGMAIENILSNVTDWNCYFYRSSNGDEIDLILEKGEKRMAIECKASTAPKLTKGFWNGLEVVKPQKSFIVSPVSDVYFLKENVMVCNPLDFIKLINDI
jgi:predicted AAA+ superfamily ATPase